VGLAANSATPIDVREGHQVMFYPVGQYATAAEYFHMTLEIDGQTHLNYMVLSIAQIKVLAEKDNKVEHTRYKKVHCAANAVETLVDIGKSMKNYLDAMLDESIIVNDNSNLKNGVEGKMENLPGKISGHQLTEEEAKKRTTSKLQDTYFPVEDYQYDLFPKLRIQPLNIISSNQDIDDSGVFDAGVQRSLFIASEIRNDFNDIVECAIKNRLSTKALLPTTLTNVFNNMSLTALKYNFRLMIDNGNDLFKLETSYYKTGPNKFRVVVHVPIVKKANMLEMLQYIPFPLSQQVLNGTSIIPIVGNRDIIAVQRDTNTILYKLLGESDLIGCKKFRNTFLCPDRDQLSTNLADTCLGSLFSHNEGGILSNCEFGLEKEKEYVFAINNNEFLVHMVEPKAVQVHCHEETLPLEMSMLTHLHLDEHCKVNLNYHQIQSGSKKSDEVHLYHTQWKWDAMKLFPNLDETQIRYIFHYLSEAGVQVFNAKDIQLWQYDVHYYLITLINSGFQLGLFCCIIGIIVALCAVLKCHCFGCNGFEVMKRKKKPCQETEKTKEPEVKVDVLPTPREKYIYRPSAPFGHRY